MRLAMILGLLFGLSAKAEVPTEKIIAAEDHCGAVFDMLEGMVLQDGESLDVLWPDGTQEIITIMVTDSKVDAVRRYRKSFYVTKHKGQTTWVALVGLPAARHQ